MASNAELAERADVVVLCHKPAQLEEVAAQVGRARAAVASILAATPTGALEAAYPDVPVYRFIPNIPAEVAPGGALLRAGPPGAPRGPRRSCSTLFGRAGAVIRLDEALIEPAMALMSCGPAFMSLVAESFADAGAAHGLDGRGRAPHDRGDHGGHGGLARPPRLRPGGPARARGHTRRRHRAGPWGSSPRGSATLARAPWTRWWRRPAMTLFAVTRADVADYVDTLILVYTS